MSDGHHKGCSWWGVEKWGTEQVKTRDLARKWLSHLSTKLIF